MWLRPGRPGPLCPAVIHACGRSPAWLSVSDKLGDEVTAGPCGLSPHTPLGQPTSANVLDLGDMAGEGAQSQGHCFSVDDGLWGDIEHSASGRLGVCRSFAVHQSILVGPTWPSPRGDPGKLLGCSDGVALRTRGGVGQRAAVCLPRGLGFLGGSPQFPLHSNEFDLRRHEETSYAFNH